MPRWLKLLLIPIAIICGIMGLTLLMKLWFIKSAYSFFLSQLVALIGLDILAARLVSILLTVVAVLFLPLTIGFFLFGRRKAEFLVATSVAVGVGLLAVHYSTREVFFDRQTGQPARYYIRTLEGYLFSSRPDYDPKFGIQYQPITPETIREHHLWEKRRKSGERLEVRELTEPPYFDMMTGKPIAWYVERDEDEIAVYPLPGFDPVTGELLKPVDKEVVKRIRSRPGTAVRRASASSSDGSVGLIGIALLLAVAAAAASGANKKTG